ncbi:type II toxin-antitoxin system Phd/YefM family antitoxin [Scytonema millei]|uniref:type II toxin-antitoxin system Phd/YefM family antitoxin n=1 Tax=Scytonema millei TaxID=1245922 RepID=UPI0025745449|nr:type II toxin-antitoxin system Phd/YefM family antitoxin [Scytonema millei]
MEEAMDAVSTSEARTNLFSLVDRVSETHKPILITGKRNNAVLISQEDWNSIQETMYLLSIPGMKESIKDGMATPVEECISWEDLRRELADSIDEASS